MTNAAVLVMLASCLAAQTNAPKYVFLFIGSGMGPEHVKAASLFAQGADGDLCFQKFPYRELADARCAEQGPPDAAAASSAIAIGHLVNRGVLSMRIPGDGSDSQTVLEYSRDRLGKSTGLVTDSFLTDAAVAAFAAHEPKSINYVEITGDYLKTSRPHVLLGGGGCGMDAEVARKAGYPVVADKEQLQKFDYAAESRICGLFGDGAMGFASQRSASLPGLVDMTSAAVSLLRKNGNGFFLVVNASNIERAAARNDINECIAEIIELDKAVQVAVNMPAEPNDKLILVTGDREMGGLTVLESNGAGKLPRVAWAGKDVTSRQVCIWSSGLGSASVSSKPDTRYVCRGAVDEPDVRPARSRWKSMVGVGLLALMAIMILISRHGGKSSEL